VVNVKVVSSYVRKKKSNCCCFGNEGEGVCVIFTKDLSEASSYPSRFVNRFGCFRVFDFPDEFGGDYIVIFGAWDDGKSVVFEVGVHFAVVGCLPEVCVGPDNASSSVVGSVSGKRGDMCRSCQVVSMIWDAGDDSGASVGVFLTLRVLSRSCGLSRGWRRGKALIAWWIICLRCGEEMKCGGT
jgi:hypothetical protein